MAAVSIPKQGREHESRSDWATPQEVFDLISKVYGPFTLDPCASADNAKCETFFTQEQDGLMQSWATEGSVFCNPAYGRELPKWAKKGIHEMQANFVRSVFLIPPRTGTPWFQDLCAEAVLVVFLRGRIAFIDPAGKRTSPMDDNCLVILDPRKGYAGTPAVNFWDWKAAIKSTRSIA